MRPLTKIQFLALAGLVRHPMHPYALRQEIIQLTGMRIWPSKSSLRRALDSLSGADLILECDSNPNYWLKARSGVPYELTLKGFERLRRELGAYDELIIKTRQRMMSDKFDAWLEGV